MIITYVFLFVTLLTAVAGLAAITAITHLLKSGDHIVSINDVYGGAWRDRKWKGRRERGKEGEISCGHIHMWF